ncbi:MAG: carboxylating nicotinate-nucleotide diphosphorylase [Actinomycetota bacterium]
MSEALRDIVRRALTEDDAWNDITTKATVPEGEKGRGRLIARVACVVAGTEAFAATFREMDESVTIDIRVPDGSRAEPGGTIASVEGSVRAILAAERTALNLIQRLSGVATLTRAFVEAAGGTEIRDTRKTTPGLRLLEKEAVRAGGGVNHRFSLGDAVLIKDNHIVSAGDIARAVRAAKDVRVHVEVECETIDQVRSALGAGADELLLDNMDVETMRRAVELAKAAGARTEASGGVSLATVGTIAKTGVDSISVGALTHSAPAIDLSLEVERI